MSAITSKLHLEKKNLLRTSIRCFCFIVEGYNKVCVVIFVNKLNNKAKITAANNSLDMISNDPFPIALP